jgi:hypothetical protein
MRKLALLFVLFAFFLLMGYTRAGQNFVSGDLENGEVRLEQNVGRDLGPMPAVRSLRAAGATRPIFRWPILSAR